MKRFKLLGAATTVFAWSYANRVADWSLIEDEYLEDYGPRVPKFDWKYKKNKTKNKNIIINSSLFP